MRYDSRTAIRGENAGNGKWDEIRGTFGCFPKGVIPFSVADMEFNMVPEVRERLKAFLNRSVMGCAAMTEEYRQTVVSWKARRHGWQIQPEWIRDTPGIINTFFTTVRASTKPDEGVMLMIPAYYPMYAAVTRHDWVLVGNSLVQKGGTYRIDFEDFAQKAAEPNIKLLVLCSPHNPSRRVWAREELEHIGRICTNNHVLVVSDEIHCDLLMPGYKHIPFGSISEEFVMNSIIYTAPSKTFNLAGLQTSNTIIASEEFRQRFYVEQQKDNGNPKCNILSLEGCRLAYAYGDAWPDECLQVIDTSRKVITDYLAREFPQVRVTRLEGTYLLQIDFRGLGIECHKLAGILKEEAHIFLDEGFIFGEVGEGFERWNLAALTSYIQAALSWLECLKKHLSGMKREVL